MLRKGPVTLSLYFPFPHCVKWDKQADFFPFSSTSALVTAEVVLLR